MKLIDEIVHGHFSFLFEKYGAKVVAFDYDKTIIKEANEKKKELNSNVEFLTADGRCPEGYFSGKLDIIFMAGFSVFAINLNREIMEKYLSLLEEGGKLVSVHNSDLTGIVRGKNCRNRKTEKLKSSFESLGCNIENIYFYVRNIIIKMLRSFVFNSFSTKLCILILKITKLPCYLVFTVKRHGQTAGSFI